MASVIPSVYLLRDECAAGSVRVPQALRYEYQLPSMRQYTSAYVGIRQHASRARTTGIALRIPAAQLTSAYVGIRWHTSAYVSIRQHTPAYVSMRRMRVPHTLRQKGMLLLTYADVC